MIGNQYFSIESCVRDGDRFIPLSASPALNLKDPSYVDGSIRVTIQGRPLITDREATDVVHWWAGMSGILRDLTQGRKSVVDGGFPDWPGTMLFEVSGDKLTWSVQVPETRTAVLDRVSALRRLMQEYKMFFERMKILNSTCSSDYDVALAYISRFGSL